MAMTRPFKCYAAITFIFSIHKKNSGKQLKGLSIIAVYIYMSTQYSNVVSRNFSITATTSPYINLGFQDNHQ